MYNQFIENLSRHLTKPLPGKLAQHKMAPVGRLDLLNAPIVGTPINSAVLILLFPENNQLNTVLIKRPSYQGVHSAQVSFPGGKTAKIDSSIEATALRECNEEIGVESSEIKLIGSLTPLYIFASNFMVYPIIGYCNYKPTFKPDKKEVDYLIQTNIDTFQNPATIKHTEVIASNGDKIATPYYNIQNEIVWGATAMIISEFVEVLNGVNG